MKTNVDISISTFAYEFDVCKLEGFVLDYVLSAIIAAETLRRRVLLSLDKESERDYKTEKNETLEVIVLSL